MTQLSDYFTLDELTQSATADEHGIEIRVERSSAAFLNLEALALRILDPVRRYLGEPVYVTSGYRPPEVNRIVGGVEGSQHTTGEAADVKPETLAPADVAYACLRLALPFDQVIVELDQGICHLSHIRGGPNRGEVLHRFVDDAGELVYREGLP